MIDFVCQADRYIYASTMLQLADGKVSLCNNRNYFVSVNVNFRCASNVCPKLYFIAKRDLS